VAPTVTTTNAHWKDTLGRVGLVGKGVVFGIVGLLALQLASGDAGTEADEVGAVEWLGAQPFGKVLLVALTISLFALSVWRLLDAVVGDPVEGDEPLDRAKYAAKGIVYGALAVVTLVATASNWGGSEPGSSGSGGESSSERATSTVLEWPAGRWLVALAGLGVIAAAGYIVKIHVVEQRYLERMSVAAHSWIAQFGRLGYGARAVAYGIIGWFLVRAGLTFDPDEAKGLSEALEELAGRGWGQAVLWVVATGLLAYGLFTVAEARYRRAA
jgi:hypothetical protein